MSQLGSCQSRVFGHSSAKPKPINLEAIDGFDFTPFVGYPHIWPIDRLPPFREFFALIRTFEA